MLKTKNRTNKHYIDIQIGYGGKYKVRIALFVIVLYCFTYCLKADSYDETDLSATQSVMIRDVVYGEIRYFVWEEYYNGLRLVKESGFIPAIGIRGLFIKINDGIALAYNTALFYGIVNYDGYVQTGDAMIPYTSDTAYFGFEGSFYTIVNIESRDFIICPLAGVKYSFWLRELGASSFIRDPYGYDEYWQMLVGMMGLQYKIQSRKRNPVIATVSGSVLFPIFVDESVDLSNVNGPSSIKLEPEGNPSFEIGMELDIPLRSISSRMIFGIFYRTVKFSESELDRTYQTFVQPESHYKISGLQMGFNF